MDHDDTLLRQLSEEFELSMTIINDEGLAEIPSGWRSIVTSNTERSRCDAALALWHRDILLALPSFAAELSQHLLDVRACLSDRGPVLLYVIERSDPWGTRIGWAPDDESETPVFWESIPDLARLFLRETHAGFTAPDGESLGIVPPSYMMTLAEFAGWPEGIPDWDKFPESEGVARVASTRLIRIGVSGGVDYCVSPDLPGKLALVYEGDIDPKPFWQALDELMVSDLLD
jgi:hypothetical protein